MDYQQKYLKYKQKYLELKEQLGGVIGDRANYEHDVYKYCNEKLVEFIHKNPHVLNYIKSMCIETVKYFMMELHKHNKLDEFVKLYNEKTTSVLSGAIKIEPLREAIVNSSNTIDIYLRENMNIRSSLTLLDFIVKFVLGKSKTFKHVSTFFDDQIRLRESHNSIDKDSSRDEMCLNNFKAPHGNIEGNKGCLPMVDLIEPYTNLEKEKYSSEELKKFNVGSNIFTAPKQNLTVDVFAAGLSGHTIDILLLFTTFVLNKVKKENVFVLVCACLIWMLNYYHHSLREIVGIAFIFIDDNYSLNYVLELFKKVNSDKKEQKKDAIDGIFELLEKETLIFKDHDYKPDYPMVENMTLFEALLKGDSDKAIKNRLDKIEIKEKMVKFLNLLHNIKTNLSLELP
jgi:hypothetical protein